MHPSCYTIDNIQRRLKFTKKKGQDDDAILKVLDDITWPLAQPIPKGNPDSPIPCLVKSVSRLGV